MCHQSIPHDGFLKTTKHSWKNSETPPKSMIRSQSVPTTASQAMRDLSSPELKVFALKDKSKVPLPDTLIRLQE